MERICGIGAPLNKTVKLTRANARQKDSKDRINRNREQKHPNEACEIHITGIFSFLTA